MAKELKIGIRWYKFIDLGNGRSIPTDAKDHTDADAVAVGSLNRTVVDKIVNKIKQLDGWEHAKAQLSKSGKSYNIFKGQGFKSNDTITITDED